MHAGPLRLHFIGPAVRREHRAAVQRLQYGAGGARQKLGERFTDEAAAVSVPRTAVRVHAAKR